MGEGTYRNRDRVQPWPDVGREPLVGEHAGKGVPEVSKRLGVLQILPVKSLEGLDGGKGRPIHGIDVPDGDGPEKTSDTVTKETDGDDCQDNGSSAQGHVVEEVLGGEDLNAGGGIGGRGRSDGTHRMLLQRPRPIVEELEEPAI